MLSLSFLPSTNPRIPPPTLSLVNCSSRRHCFSCCSATPHSSLTNQNVSVSTAGERTSSSPPPDANNNSEEDEEFKVLTAARSNYNEILIIESRESRILLLDESQNVHSILRKGQKWTDSYWDEFASLPAIVPQGPVAIFGLGGGTAAHLLLDSWPSLQLEGWELDEILIDKAREYFALSDLEKNTDDGGFLRIHIGDALSSSTNIPGGYAGIIVDLFSDGIVLPELEEAETWVEMSKKIMSNGRIMVNCGGSTSGVSEEVDGANEWVRNSTLRALFEAFGGQLNWKKMPDTKGANYLAVTGPLPDLTLWSEAVPSHLSSSVKLWRSCKLLS